MQFGLFGTPESTTIIDNDGIAIYYPEFFTQKNSIFDSLLENINWRQDNITLYGKTHLVPRLHAWYADDNKSYSYSGIDLPVNEWCPSLEMIRTEISTKLSLEFNSVLCNLYRSGSDYAAWHSDDEIELGKNPIIASASFGESRKMTFKHKTRKSVEQVSIELEDSSLLVMKGSLQHHWKHQLNKTAKKIDQRINLTFRTIG